MNTANKRASAIGIGLAIRLVLPVPDGTVHQPDRQQVAYSYAGIQAANPVPIPNITQVTDVKVGPASAAMNVHCGAVSRAIEVDVRSVSTAVNVKVT